MQGGGRGEGEREREAGRGARRRKRKPGRIKRMGDVAHQKSRTMEMIMMGLFGCRAGLTSHPTYQNCRFPRRRLTAVTR